MFAQQYDAPMVRQYRPGEYWLSRGEALIKRLKAEYPKHTDAELRAVIENMPAALLMPGANARYVKSVTTIALSLLPGPEQASTTV